MTPSSDDPQIVLDLLDSAHGSTLQTWRVSGNKFVRIGRSDDNDIVIADPRISRSHVELRPESEGWLLVSKGRNPVLIDGLPVAETILVDRGLFQLCSGGPMLRFRQVSSPSVTNSATIDNFDQSILNELRVDEQKMIAEVREITGGRLFQELKLRANEMRRRGEQTEDHSPDDVTRSG